MAVNINCELNEVSLNALKTENIKFEPNEVSLNALETENIKCEPNEVSLNALETENIKCEPNEVSLNALETENIKCEPKEVSLNALETENIECESNEVSLNTAETASTNNVTNQNDQNFVKFTTEQLTSSILAKRIITYNRDCGTIEIRTFRDGLPMKINFKCDECSKLFDSKKLLNEHVETHHQRISIESYSCLTICEDENEAKKHQKGGDKETITAETKLSCRKHRCKSCGKKYRRESHLKTHTVSCGLKELRCEKCFKMFPNIHKLNAHSCPLKGVGYRCNVCNEGFNQKDDLYQHFFVHKFTQGYDLLF